MEHVRAVQRQRGLNVTVKIKLANDQTARIEASAGDRFSFYASALAPIALACGLVLCLGLSVPVAAQQQWPSDPAVRPATPPTQPKAATSKAQAKAQPKAAAKDDPAPGKSVETQLRQRVEQLEEQLADMQVTMGTLESFGKAGNGGSGPAPSRAGGGGSVADQARIDSMETQLRALAVQVEQLSSQLRQANRRSEADPMTPARPEATPAPGGFGKVTVTPGGDPIARMIETPPAAASPAASLPPEAQAAGNPKQLYEVAYTYLLQQDYGSAEVAFEEFLRRYPTDRQAADAQYWYGETLYVQRRYKPAAQAFLKVMDKYGASAKVPNSILKLAMTLEQLGQKDCGLFTTLESSHPNAPVDVKSKAQALKQRVGC